jgi:hypothetical protein
MENEIWKVFGPDGMFRVSDLGRIQTRTVSAGRGGAILGETWKDKPQSFCRCDRYGGGYFKVGITLGKRNYKSEYVHRIVAENFIDAIPKGMQVNHIDGNRRNNRVDNLEIVSPSENLKNAAARNAWAHVQGELRLSEAQADFILAYLREGRSKLSLAKLVGVNRKLIHSVATGQSGYRRQYEKLYKE